MLDQHFRGSACKTCRFYHPRPDFGEIGECRRNPPEMARSFEVLRDGESPANSITGGPVTQGVWPLVGPSDWCGEYRPFAGKD